MNRLAAWWWAACLTAETAWRCWRISRKYGIPYQPLFDAHVEMVRRMGVQVREEALDAKRREKANLN